MFYFPMTSNDIKYYILMIVAFIISMIIQFNVQATFARYSKVPVRKGVSGLETARRILDDNRVYNVSIVPVAGSMTDHYNPGNKSVNLSEPVYGETSIAAVAVSAHECGHAMQHAFGYAPLSFRTALFPIANFSSKISWILIALGIYFNTVNSGLLLKIGIILFSAAVLFQVVTLPVEFNASRRALNQLRMNGILAEDEMQGAKAVLSAAALTYVAAAGTSIIQLLRLISLARSRDD